MKYYQTFYYLLFIKLNLLSEKIFISLNPIGNSTYQFEILLFIKNYLKIFIKIYF
jgi:hypothetical protein